MNKKDNRDIIIIAVLINGGIFGGIGIIIWGAIANIFWLSISGFIFIGVIGILCPIAQGVIAYKSASDHDKKAAKKQLTDARDTILNMSGKELALTVSIFIIVFSIFILIIVFGILQNFPAMIICIVAFVGFGLGAGFLTMHLQGRTDAKIIQSKSAERIMGMVVSRQLFSSINGAEKYRYKLLIEGKDIYGVSDRSIQSGEEVLILYDKKKPKHCVIL